MAVQQAEGGGQNSVRGRENMAFLMAKEIEAAVGAWCMY
jgi:hypothetical protein